MKLLPYVVRTLCRRKGLSVLSESAGGAGACDRRCLDLLWSWGASVDAVRGWIPFPRGWGRYTLAKMGRSDGGSGAATDDLPPPSGRRYLKHLDRYGEIFYAECNLDDAEEPPPTERPADDADRPEDEGDGGGGDDDDDDDEGELVRLVRELRAASSSSASAGVENVADRRPGLLVYFPAGIPGCGKSALCSAATTESLRPMIRAAGDGEEGKGVGEESGNKEERPVIVRVGDDVNEKYWPLVRRERSERPSSVYVADKNAPPSAWGTVEGVRLKTRGAGVPVLPDAMALSTTAIAWEEEGVRRVEEFPLSLPYLAVCVCRVLDRPAGAHKGKLDSGTEGAAMVAVMFYCLYRNRTAEGMESMFDNGASGGRGAIRVPFFAAQEALPELPDELDWALRDAVRLQIALDGRNGDKKMKPEGDGALRCMEDRLRALVARHRSELDAMVAPLDESRASFLRQLGEWVAALD